MRMPDKKYLLGAAALVVLGAGVAQASTNTLHTMQADAPNGSIVHIQYTGDVAPKVQFVPAELTPTEASLAELENPFVEMQRMSAMMNAQMDAMMQRAAMMQERADSMSQHASASTPGQDIHGATAMPHGMQMTYYSASTDENGCTRSVSYSSDGSQAAPKMTQVASDACEAVTPNTDAIPAKAQAPASHGRQPGQRV